MGQKILVVEDNELNLKLFCDLLRAHGYEAEPVRDGREAVERARAFGPELIVMDIQMPHITGLELIEQLKADPELKTVPVMAVTAYAAKGDEERIRDAGAEGYVSKPISLTRFIDAVRGLLAERECAEPERPPAVQISRHFDAPAEQLFDSWLDPETVGTLLSAAMSGDMVRVELDGRVGGTFTIVVPRDGKDVVHSGLYEALERPRRLVVGLREPPPSKEPFRIVIQIKEDDGRRLLLLTQEGMIGSADIVARSEEALSAILAALADRLGESREGHDQ